MNIFGTCGGRSDFTNIFGTTTAAAQTDLGSDVLKRISFLKKNGHTTNGDRVFYIYKSFHFVDISG